MVKASLAQYPAARSDVMITFPVKMNSFQKTKAQADQFEGSLQRTKSSPRMIEGGLSGVTYHLRTMGVVNSGDCTTGLPSGLEYALERLMGAPVFRYWGRSALTGVNLYNTASNTIHYECYAQSRSSKRASEFYGAIGRPQLVSPLTLRA